MRSKSFLLGYVFLLSAGLSLSGACGGMVDEDPLAMAEPAASAHRAQDLSVNELCPIRVPRPGFVPPPPNGCTRSPDRFGRASFLAACNVHDNCYGTCNSDRNSCDQQLLTNLMLSCRVAYEPEDRRLDLCRERAEVYFRAVTELGDSFHAEAQGAACVCCGDGEENCSNECRDVQADKENCGSCGNACALDETCVAGDCVKSESADLSVLGDPTPFSPADVNTETPFLFFVDNNGPDDAQNVVVRITFFGDVSNMEAEFTLNDNGSWTGAPDGYCSVVSSELVCNLGTLAVGEFANITGTVVGLSAGTASASAIVSSSTPDPDWSEDAATVGWAFQACPDGLFRCDDDCVDLGADTGNCGACELACSPGQSCFNGECCTATTCAAADAECGTLDDSCGNSLDCGTCPFPQACVANLCDCEPTTCNDGGAECGSIDDGCGGTLDCGDCSDLEMCEGKRCVPVCQGLSANGAPPGCFPTRDDALAAACAFNNPDLSTPGYAYYRDSCVFNSSDAADTSFTVYAHWTELSSGNTGYFDYQGDPWQFQPCEFPCP